LTEVLFIPSMFILSRLLYPVGLANQWRLSHLIAFQAKMAPSNAYLFTG
jgi:hypothetical protein